MRNLKKEDTKMINYNGTYNGQTNSAIAEQIIAAIGCEFEGSEKQISWAKSIRKEWIAEALNFIPKEGSANASNPKMIEVAELTKEMVEKALKETSARVWIDSYRNGAKQMIGNEVKLRGIL